nr:hypothetical protein [Actinomycetota bacterium]
MRLRVLLPRPRRGRGLRGLRRLAAVLAAAALLSACGEEDREPSASLAVGLTEFSPAALTGPLGRALRPRHARVYVLWSGVQRTAGGRLD